MLTKTELLAKLQAAREVVQLYDSLMADVVLSLEEEHNDPLDDDLQSETTGMLYDELTEVEAHVNGLP